MSIASEYARECRIKREILKSAQEESTKHEDTYPRIEIGRSNSTSPGKFVVDLDGDLRAEGYTYSPKEARRLALWILATFVEE